MHNSQQLQPNQNTDQNHKPSNIYILLPLTLPSSGKSTTFLNMKQAISNFRMQIISSDEIRNRHMVKMMEANPNLSKKQAYEQTKDGADSSYYQQINGLLKQIDKEQSNRNSVVVLDKNYSLITLYPAIQHIKKIIAQFSHLPIKLFGVLPKCSSQLIIKQSLNYPFSICFICCCLKRIISRHKHPVLEGTPSYRVAVCLGWANNLRNFMSQYNRLGQQLDGFIEIPFTEEQQVPSQLQQLITKILDESKPGTFNQHPQVQHLVEGLSKWKYKEIQKQQKINEISDILVAKFG